MATQKTNEAKAIDDGLVQKRLPGNVASANVLFLEATYETRGSETTGDKIDIGDVPAGSIVLPELTRIAHEAGVGGTSVAISKIGDAADDDRYSATSFSIHASNAGQAPITPNIADGIITRTPVTAATKRVIATLTHGGAPDANKKLKFIIAYRPRA